MRKKSSVLFLMVFLMVGMLFLSESVYASKSSRRTGGGSTPSAVNALANLNEALSNLNNAPDDRGGYKARAIKDVKHAIEQVERSISPER